MQKFDLIYGTHGAGLSLIFVRILEFGRTLFTCYLKVITARAFPLVFRTIQVRKSLHSFFCNRKDRTIISVCWQAVAKVLASGISNSVPRPRAASPKPLEALVQVKSFVCTRMYFQWKEAVTQCVLGQGFETYKCNPTSLHSKPTWDKPPVNVSDCVRHIFLQWERDVSWSLHFLTFRSFYASFALLFRFFIARFKAIICDFLKLKFYSALSSKIALQF